MSRLLHVGLGAALAAALFVSCGRRTRAPSPAEPAPSVLLVTIDTLRADRVGAYGYAGARTPNLDALAREGVLFEEALSPVPLTLPAHATLLSGIDPPRHGVHDNGTYVFPEDLPTLATLARQQGLATGAFVGAFVLDRRFGLARGFDHYDDAIGRRRSGGSVLESERPCEAVAAAASAWIGRQAGPFLAWAHFYDPHAPYQPPPAHAGAHPGQPYDGEVAYADSCLGTLLAAARGRAGGRLLVAATSDHGEGLGDHGERTHGYFIYQPTLRVPLILAGPGLPRGERRGMARAADLLPTLLARLGLAAPPSIDGRDLLAAAPREAYAETDYPQTLGFAPLRSVRLGALKLIDAPRPELYDLAADPGETRNLAAQRAADVERLRAALAAAGKGARSSQAAADAAVAERLRALGYVGGGPAATTTGPAEDPKDALPLWQRFEEATWAQARGAHGDAVRLLRALVAERPANAAFRRGLAAALRESGRAGDAATFLESGPPPPATDALGWHERALALSAASRPAQALEAEDRALAANPALPEAHNHRGTLLAAQGRLDVALAAFGEAVRLDPNNAEARVNRANVLRALGRRAEAAAEYRAAAERDPSAAGPLNGLGVLAVEAGDLAGAARLFGEVLARDPAYHEARLNLAVVEAKRGDTEAARRHLRELVSRAPGTPVAARAGAFLAQLGGATAR